MSVRVYLHVFSKQIFFLLCFLPFSAKISAQQPILKKQINLNSVSEIISSPRSNSFLVRQINNFTLVDYSSKIQKGTIKLDLNAYGIPGKEKVVLPDDSSFFISTGIEILHVNMLNEKIDTVFNANKFPEYIMAYTDVPWDEDLLLIATKTYPLQKNETVRFIDLSGDSKLYLYDVRNRQTLKVRSIPFQVMTFDVDVMNKHFYAGSAEGDLWAIDSHLEAKKIADIFDRPVFALQLKLPYVVMVPHRSKEDYIGNSGEGNVHIYNLENNEIKNVVLENELPYRRDEYSIEIGANNYVNNLFYFPKEKSVMLSYGFNRLVELHLEDLSVYRYPSKHISVAYFQNFNDPDLVFSTVEKEPSLAAVHGNIVLYDIRKEDFLHDFTRPLKSASFKSISKVFDHEGNYHYLGLSKYTGWNGNDTLVVFSSNRIAPLEIDFAVTTQMNADGTLVYQDQGMGNNYLLQLHPDKMQGNYTVQYDMSFRNSKLVQDGAVEIILDLDLIKNSKGLPYYVSNAEKMTDNRYLLFTDEYKGEGKSNAFTIVISDSLGNVVFKTPEFELAGRRDYGYSKDGKFLAYQFKKGAVTNMEVWDIERGQKLFSRANKNEAIWHFTFDAQLPVLWFLTYADGNRTSYLYKMTLLDSNMIPELKQTNPDFISFEVDESGNLLAGENYNHYKLYSLPDFEERRKGNPLGSSIKISKLKDGYGFSTNSEFHSVNAKGEYVDYFIFEGNQATEILNNQFYRGDKNAIRNFGFVMGNAAYPYQDFDAYFNRPDEVMRASGNRNREVTEMYEKIIQKRKVQQDIPEFDLNEIRSIPKVNIKNKALFTDVIQDKSIKIPIRFDHPVLPSSLSLHVLNNGVPIFGKNGMLVSQLSGGDEIEVSLIDGLNELQFFTADQSGRNSLSENLTVVASLLNAKPRIHYIGIGIDQYLQEEYNLKYGVKDARDIASKIKSKYPDAVIDTLFDQQVTRENMFALKQKLLQLLPEDILIISYSGHGLLDENMDYYLSTYSVNFDKPEEGGLSYADFESLIDGIAPLRKLVLIDACHSGELDKDELLAMNNDELPEGVRGSIAISTVNKKSVGIENSFLMMQNLFFDVRKGTGASIISAAGATEYAYEKGDLKNGVFTYSILDAMSTNTVLNVSELKKLVEEKVVELTGGKQRPTSRGETLNYDWTVW